MGSSNLLLRTLVISAMLLQLTWFFLPQVEYRWMSEEMIVLTEYSGFGALIDFPVWFYWTNLAVTLVVLALILLFGYRVRYIALACFVLSILGYVPVAGMNVESGLSMTFRDFLGLIQGAVLVLLFTGARSSKARQVDRAPSA